MGRKQWNGEPVFLSRLQNNCSIQSQEELNKDDRIIAIETLFPHNSEFEKLRNFKTPKNSIFIGVFIVASAVFFLLTAIFFLIQYFRKKDNQKHSNISLLLFPLGLILFSYMIVLKVDRRVNVFYFPAPYKNPTNIFISLTSYIPFLLLLLIIPFSVINYKILKDRRWSAISMGLFTLNNLVYISLIGLFACWKFYDVFN